MSLYALSALLRTFSVIWKPSDETCCATMTFAKSVSVPSSYAFASSEALFCARATSFKPSENLSVKSHWVQHAGYFQPVMLFEPLDFVRLKNVTI